MQRLMFKKDGLHLDLAGHYLKLVKIEHVADYVHFWMLIIV